MAGITSHYFDLTNPVAVANGVLGFLKEKDLSGIISLLNDANRQILYAGKSRKFLRGIEKKLEKTATMFARVEKVSEIREMYRYKAGCPLPSSSGPDLLVLAGKIRQDNHQLHAVALTREGNRYFFDQLISTHVLEYERWQAFAESSPACSPENTQRSFERCFGA